MQMVFYGLYLISITYYHYLSKVAQLNGQVYVDILNDRSMLCSTLETILVSIDSILITQDGTGTALAYTVIWRSKWPQITFFHSFRLC